MARCTNCFSEINTEKCPYCGYEESDSISGIGVNLRPGTVIGKKYISGQLLGSGGFGNTYLAFDTEQEIKVAIKEFHPKGQMVRGDDKKTLISVDSEKHSCKEGIEKFIKEAEILEKFKDAPTIVAIYDVFQENGTAYMVMEYVDGMTLEQKAILKKNADE